MMPRPSAMGIEMTYAKSLHLLFAAIAGMWALSYSPARAEHPPLPQDASDLHLGVTTCAGSTCHGAVSRWRDGNVAQNEYSIWHKNDKHAQAYKVLTEDRSKRIAQNLGLPNAHEAKICLDCHSDNVAAEKRGREFQVSDGVGCEACHGGGERWLGQHVSGRVSHAENVAKGMYPTENPTHRASLCLSCHLGNGEKFVTHKIMAAGHPRLSFELDTYTSTQPAHFSNDASYRRRKNVESGLKVWVVGQAMGLRNMMTIIADPDQRHSAMLPEFSLYDCQSCHHPLTSLQWRPRITQSLNPGALRIQDHYTLMTLLAARQFAPALAEELLDRSRALGTASTKDREAMVAAAERLGETASKLATAFANANMGPDQISTMLQTLLAEGAQGTYPDYAAAEQATMALHTLIQAQFDAAAISKQRLQTMEAALAYCYAAVKSDFEFKPETFQQAVKKVQETAAR